MNDSKRSRFHLERRKREIDAINALARTLFSSPSLDRVVTCTYRQIYRATESDLVVLYFREGDKLCFQEAAAEQAVEHDAAAEIRVGKCLCGIAAETGKAVYSSDINSDPRCTLDECKRAGVRSFAALPLVVEEEILGVLGIGSLKKRDFAKQSVFLEILASQVAIAVTERRRAFDASGAWTPEYQSKAMKTALNEARLAAATGSTILLTGESGAGKDRFARFIHDHSGRSDRPFHAINCAAIPLELAESELFGHEAGAFTGARGRKRGIFEIADGGTLLLNEIGDLPPSIQGKLLAFLDTKSFTRVGGERSLTVDVRLIAATNRDLQKEVGEGRFRQDLFFRLNVFSVKVPPLRERIEDLPALVHEITCELAAEMCLSNWPLLSVETVAMMKRHRWPGNVRELRNLLARTLVLYADEESVEVETLGPQPYQQEETAPGLSLPKDKSMRDLFAEMERSFIEEAFRRSGGKKEAAAELLGISRHALKRRLKKYPELVAKPRTK